MPQVRLECSQRLSDLVDTGRFFAALHETLVLTVNATLGACKSRLSVVEGVHIADGAANRDMVHLEIGLLPGRTADQKTQLGVAALDHLKTLVAAPGTNAGLEIHVSVRLFDMDAVTYFKDVVLPETAAD